MRFDGFDKQAVGPDFFILMVIIFLLIIAVVVVLRKYLRIDKIFHQLDELVSCITATHNEIIKNIKSQLSIGDKVNEVDWNNIQVSIMGYDDIIEKYAPDMTNAIQSEKDSYIKLLEQYKELINRLRVENGNLRKELTNLATEKSFLNSAIVGLHKNRLMQIKQFTDNIDKSDPEGADGFKKDTSKFDAEQQKEFIEDIFKEDHKKVHEV